LFLDNRIKLITTMKTYLVSMVAGDRWLEGHANSNGRRPATNG
jgi:hypothetical protein